MWICVGRDGLLAHLKFREIPPHVVERGKGSASGINDAGMFPSAFRIRRPFDMSATIATGSSATPPGSNSVPDSSKTGEGAAELPREAAIAF